MVPALDCYRCSRNCDCDAMKHALDCGISCGLAACDCGAVKGLYRVLKDYPRTEKTGETQQTAEGLIRWQRVTEWRHLGYAESYEDAKRKFGGYPVLEWIGTTH